MGWSGGGTEHTETPFGMLGAVLLILYPNSASLLLPFSGGAASRVGICFLTPVLVG